MAENEGKLGEKEQSRKEKIIFCDGKSRARDLGRKLEVGVNPYKILKTKENTMSSLINKYFYDNNKSLH